MKDQFFQKFELFDKANENFYILHASSGKNLLYSVKIQLYLIKKMRK